MVGQSYLVDNACRREERRWRRYVNSGQFEKDCARKLWKRALEKVCGEAHHADDAQMVAMRMISDIAPERLNDYVLMHPAAQEEGD